MRSKSPYFNQYSARKLLSLREVTLHNHIPKAEYVSLVQLEVPTTLISTHGICFPSADIGAIIVTDNHVLAVARQDIFS